ncbi:hypothetical protein BT96DRAFT_913705 [Gymnopus androsaceus JB14]|uniref:Uncharacterized protein n=1 Tax=Gymnopus androsaceus JB14 TaxID=1447944 RepID=A0A6A4ID58_9AGAR|nr:hypothetical protein BT96DRAFT_913705 [Gymnopus androsaceus JB14]
MIRKIIATADQFRTSGLTTAEMFKLALKQPPPENFQKFPVPSGTEILYTNSGKRKTLPPSPPHPEHPVRSIRFLKTHVLPVLEGQKEIRLAQGKRFTVVPEAKVEAKTKKGKGKGKGNAASASASSAPQQPISHNVMVWMPTQKPRIEKQILPSPPATLSGAAVGVGEDWGHLNRRRKGARDEKVKRDFALMVRVKSAENQERKRLAWEALQARNKEKQVEQDVQI